MMNSFKLFLLLTPFLFTSCASYIDRIHQELDQEEGISALNNQDNFDQFRNQAQQPAPNMHTNFTAPNYRQQPAYEPSTYQSRSTANTSHVSPAVKRDYRPMEEAQKRYRVDDLTDSQNEASLWSGQGKDNNLFCTCVSPYVRIPYLNPSS